MLEAIEKMQRNLTSSNDAEINIDELMGEEDFIIEQFDREQFNKINAEIGKKMTGILDRAEYYLK